jgi:ribulose-phosphate 3-epimerase
MAILAPSLLSADFTRLGEQINILDKAGVKYLHYDVMDGIFVPNISVGIPVLKSIRSFTDLVLDVHLMITEPERYIKAFADAGADIINIHYEATEKHIDTLKYIRELGKIPAITIKPKTDWHEIIPYLEYVDMVLVMSVEPGFGGQSFIPTSLDAVKGLAEYRKQSSLNYTIEIDGGINLDNVQNVIDTGVDIVVAGSSVFKSDLAEQTARFMKITKG